MEGHPMAGLFPDPLANSTVEPALLAKVTELHGTVRQWLDESIAAEERKYLRSSVPYADLMFAYGFATLGDTPSAEKLLADAGEVLEGPIPPQRDPEKDADLVTVRLVRDFLLKAFQYRIGEALRGNPHTGPLSAEVLADWDEITYRARTGSPNNRHQRAEYVISRFRELSWIIQPTDKPNVYENWTKHTDALTRKLSQLSLIREPTQLAERIRKLLREGVPGQQPAAVSFFLLQDCFPLAMRAGEAVALEMLARVPEALRYQPGPCREEPYWATKEGSLIAQALSVAAHFAQTEIVKSLMTEVITQVHCKAEESRFRFINAVFSESLRDLKQLGLMNEIEPLLTQLQQELPRGESVAEVKLKYAFKHEMWGALLQSLVHIASGWLMIDRRELAEPILNEARHELLHRDSYALYPKEYTELARAYIRALGEAGQETGLNRIIELFREMPRTKITNTWTTAQYYSRFHLNLVEDTVAAVCRMLAEPTPHVVG
jgi:cellulose synthase operon protein C